MTTAGFYGLCQVLESQRNIGVVLQVAVVSYSLSLSLSLSRSLSLSLSLSLYLSPRIPFVTLQFSHAISV